MAVKLNLLPPELAVDKNLGAVLKISRSLGIISLAAFILFVVGISGFFIFDSITLKNLNTDISTLTSQISTQSTSEQQIVLLKDRIKKISSVQTIPTSLPNLVAIDPFLSNLSSTATVGELNVDSQKMNLLVSFKSNDDLSSFLKNMSNSGVFKNVTLTTFGLNPSSGYSVGTSIQIK